MLHKKSYEYIVQTLNVSTVCTPSCISLMQLYFTTDIIYENINWYYYRNTAALLGVEVVFFLNIKHASGTKFYVCLSSLPLEGETLEDSTVVNQAMPRLERNLNFLTPVKWRQFRWVPLNSTKKSIYYSRKYA